LSSYSSDDSVSGTGLQLAPVGEDGPSFSSLKDSFQRCVADLQPYVAQTAQNYSTRYALWGGQSADGKKHARGLNGVSEPTPWDGASDLRVYLADNLINKKVAMKCMAVKRANLVAVPIEGNDIKRAKVVSNFMRWLIQTQMPDVDREIELLAQYLEEKGAAVTGQFWETSQEKVLTEVRLEDFQKQFPDVDMQALLDSGDADDYLKSLFQEIFGVNKAKSAKMLKELTQKGITTVAQIGKERSRPVMRAFNLDNDLFIPPDTTDIEQATGIYRVQYFTPEKMRSMVHTDGWNEAWVEDAIEKCKGRMISVTPSEYQQPMNRSFIYTQQRFTDKVGVVYAYQRLSDDEGYPGIYLTIFNPDLPPDGDHPGYAKFSLYGDNSGQYPFVLHRREFLSRKLHDSRGIPEPLKPLQDTIKAHKDARIDTASYNIMPTLYYPIGRPPLKHGAGARVPERRPNEYHYGQPIPFDQTTEESLKTLNSDALDYVGFGKDENGEGSNPMENQFQTDKFLTGVARAFRQIWNLYKKFGSEEVYFRVIGLQSSDATKFERGPEGEDFDFYMTFDVQSMDFEKMTEKINAIGQICQTLDRDGATNYTELLQVALENIDPNIAQRILQPADVGQQKVVDEVQGDLTKISAGISVNLKPNTPPQIAQATVQNWSLSPDVVARYQQDEAFRSRVDAYTKQIEFAGEQQQNKIIGRMGAITPTPAIGS